MQFLLTGSEMSACDTRTSQVIGIPSLVLMERAALSVADGADEYLKRAGKNHGLVLIVAGRGNNGADGLAAGRILLDRGYKVKFLRLAGEISPGSSFDVQENILKKYGAEVGIFSDEAADACLGSRSRGDIPDVIIDGLFGTGLSRELRGQAAEAVLFVNRCRKIFGSYVIAVDIPSGISSDDGRVMGCAAVCNETRTFAFLKRGHVLYPGASYTGSLHLAQIGITSLSFEKMPGMFTMSGETADDLLPGRAPSGNKGTFGKVLIVAGQKNMCGAALLAGSACLAAGAGMVKIFTHEANRLIIQQQLPEALLETYFDHESREETSARLRSSIDWADVAAAGPGMGNGETPEFLLRALLEYGQTGLEGIVLDADALRILSKKPDLRKALADRRENLPCVLTPHLAEFAGLAGLSLRECAENRFQIVQDMADLLRCTIACKDARTLVADPSFRGRPPKMQYLNLSGNSGMATAGSGDVLTGMTAAYLAAFLKMKKNPIGGSADRCFENGGHLSADDNMGVYCKNDRFPGADGCANTCIANKIFSNTDGFSDILSSLTAGIGIVQDNDPEPDSNPAIRNVFLSENKADQLGSEFADADDDHEKENAFTSVCADADQTDGFKAAVCAVYLHGKAGDIARGLRGERGMTARDIVEVLRSPGFFK